PTDQRAAMDELHYGTYLVANVLCSSPFLESSYDTWTDCAPFTDVIVADWVTRKPGEKRAGKQVLTVYYPLGYANASVLSAGTYDGFRDAGGDVRVVDLRDFPMPLMDQDLEAQIGLPEKGREFRDLMISHDGFLIACPEHNTSMTALLKNALDWASRQQPGEKSRICFDGKVCALFS